MSKSTVPVDTGYTNQFYGKVSVMFDNVPKARALAIQVQRWKKEGKSVVEIKRLFAQHSRPQLQEIYHQVRKADTVQSFIPPPPPAAEVYGRFAKGTNVLDIGTREGRRCKKFSGTLRITAVDPELSAPAGLFFRQLKMDIGDLLPTLDKSVILSSFMSLCQLPVHLQLQVVQFDGIHMVPDHNQLLDMGAAEVRDNGICVYTPIRNYVDNKVVVTGVNNYPGYLLNCSFAAREVKIKTLDPVAETYRPEIDASPCAYDDLNFSDLSMKMDGTAYELELNYEPGKSSILNRCGKGWSVEANFEDHLCLHVEKLEECYTLIRIVMYRGFVPPHSLKVLNDFVEAVDITIDGKPILAPPPWSNDNDEKLVSVEDRKRNMVYFEKTDGLISRFRGCDFYCKHQWTVDLYDDSVKGVIKTLDSLGLTAQFQPNPGFWEYGLNRSDEIVVFEPLRPRNDKTRATTMATLKYLLSRKTLQERLVLNNV